MRRLGLWAASAALLAAVVTAAAGAPTTWTHGYDVSWPQCAGSSAHHLPGGAPPFVILGLTHGTGHTANPCLSDQLAWARKHGSMVGAYLVPSYPTARQRAAATTGPYGSCGSSQTCRLDNDGAAQATDALQVMAGAGLAAPMVWVDVEFRRTQPWSSHDARNRAVLAGVFRGLTEAQMPFGVYTTSYMWDAITGGWTIRVPNWLPSGDGKPAHAKAMCRATGTGGPTWVVQYTREWDGDLTCPIMDAVPGRPGRLWRYRHDRLQLGSTGSPVAALQRALRLSPNGHYDGTTTVTVARFQRDHRLPVNGSVDADDWRALGAFRRTGGHPFLLSRMVAR